MDTFRLHNKFFLITLMGLIGTLIGISSATAPTVLPFAILALIFTILIFKIPTKYVFSLILFTIFIDISPISLMGSYIRISQAIFMIFFLQFLFLRAKNKISNIKTPFMISLFLWYITFFLAWFNLLSQSDLIAILVGQFYLYLLYFGIYQYNLTLNYEEQLKMIKYFLNGAILIVVIGVIELPFITAGIIPGYERGIGIQSPSSLMREPDWYGLVCAYVALFLFTFMTNNKSLYTMKRTKFYFYISCLGMILSMTRAAWVAFLCGIIILFLTMNISKKIKLIRLGIILSFFMAFLFLITYLVAPDKANTILSRINPSTTMTNDNGAGNSRLASMQIMMYFIDKHPWVGNGAGGMAAVSSMTQVVHQYIDGDINAGRGNANLFLTSLFDSGIIGTIFLTSFIILYLVKMTKIYRKTKDIIILAFIVTFIGMIGDFMFNNGIRFGFFWVHIALSVSYKYKESIMKTLKTKPTI